MIGSTPLWNNRREHPAWVGAAALWGAVLVGARATPAGRAGEAGSAPLPRSKPAIVDLGPQFPDARKAGRRPELWRHYMHGVVDRYAVPVRWADMLGPEQDRERWLTDAHPIRTPLKESDVPVIRCRRSDSIELSKPIPLDMDAVRGKKIRLFVWMKGEDVGARNNTWHCPSMVVISKDAAGKVLSSSDSHFKTQRSFPWHCYYTDRFVPEKAAGVYIRLFNKFHGTAYFGTLSWELVTNANTYSADEKQDPHTGSLAKNPLHDPLAYHLQCGFGYRYPWRFVLGEAIGMRGHTHDITTKAGLRSYYFEKAKKHPDEMNHAVLYLQSLYRNGVKRELLPPMEDGWLETFADILVGDQDPETGFWHDGRRLSLGLTFHLCDMHFRYYGIPRADREDLIYPGQDLGLRCVPRAETIIRTALRQQSTWVDEESVRRRAAWNRAAYGYTTEPDTYEQKCYLGSTWDAIYLIRLASRYVGPDLQEEVYGAVKDAFEYVLRRIVYEDGTFRQHDTDSHPTSGEYMGGIMRDVSWLERRVLEAIPEPDLVAETGKDGVRLTWRTPVGSQNSVRVYAVPEGVAGARVEHSALVGIIHRRGRKVHEMDPFLAVWKIRRAAAERWGGTTDLPPAESWRGRKYLPWKLRQIRYPLARRDDLAPLTLPPHTTKGKVLYASAATWYGEESKPVRIRPARQ